MRARSVKLLVSACLLGIALALANCNTVKGVGQDLQDISDNTREALSD